MLSYLKTKSNMIYIIWATYETANDNGIIYQCYPIETGENLIEVHERDVLVIDTNMAVVEAYKIPVKDNKQALPTISLSSLQKCPICNSPLLKTIDVKEVKSGAMERRYHYQCLAHFKRVIKGANKDEIIYVTQCMNDEVVVKQLEKREELRKYLVNYIRKSGCDTWWIDKLVKPMLNIKSDTEIIKSVQRKYRLIP